MSSQESPDAAAQLCPRRRAVLQAARFHGVELDPGECRAAPAAGGVSAARLSQWAQEGGLWARALRLRWRHLLQFQPSEPVVLLLADGSAALQLGADARRGIVLLKDPAAAEGEPATPVDEVMLSRVWSGQALLIRRARALSEAETPFGFAWLAQIVAAERRTFVDIGVASLAISVLAIFPPFIVMAVVNRVLQFQSYSTLAMLSAAIAVVTIYEGLLGYARRLAVAIVGARLDAKLNLHLFNRLVRLNLEYFEQNPAGETMFRLGQIHKIRAFLTGKLLSTFLDLVTLAILLPILFLLNATLAWIVLVCALAVTGVIVAFLHPMKRAYARVMAAETAKAATLGETIVGIRTVKSLALEPQRRAQWDERVALAGAHQIAFAKLSNWPQTLVAPLDRMMSTGTILIGAYLAMNDPSGYMVGGLFAFMMLGARVAQPLVSMARLLEDWEEVRAAVSEVGFVLNRPIEGAAGGLRPSFAGAIAFKELTFTYPGAKQPALTRVSFEIAPGQMVGVVGRSGSGKSTIARLLQGINRDYSGFLKLDSLDLREIDLRYLRQNLGVVLQDNFLFRGSIQDNIIAGRPGLSLADAVRAARLAGAEEFIERMPNGYNSYVEEGSPNLSGGQRQRIAIARALIHDPKVMILDEATSALDPESEAVVNANLLRIGKGRTMIIVSHRLSSLTECDSILVLDNGAVLDMAPHAVLLERCATYRQLWQQQNRHMETASARLAAVPGAFSRGPA